jgi:hemerythrin superfamily protein
MNPIELLMSEHAAFRIHFRQLRDLNSEYFFEIDDFILGCHAKVEDEVVFPALRKAGGPEAEKIDKTTRKLEEEHKLIEMLSSNLKQAVVEGTKALDRDKIALYASTVESHNDSEEIFVFKFWNDLDRETQASSTDGVKRIISEFGTARYLRLTGFSQEFLSLLV